MKILIISYTYSPAVGPRSIRWEALANHWSENGHDVSVITATHSDNDVSKNGVEVIRVPENWIGRIRSRLLKSGDHNNEVRKDNKDAITENYQNNLVNLFILRLKSLVKIVYEIFLKNFHWPDYAWSWIVKARKATISHLKSKGNCDVLISVSHPFSGHLVGIYAKRFFPKLKWIMDMGDPFCFLVQSQPNNFKIYGKLNKIIEGKCFDISDGMVVTTPETKNEYIRIFPNIHIKMKVIPPLISNEASYFIRKNKKDNTNKNSILKLVFIGTLYASIRHPRNLIELLDASSYKVKKKIEVHFVGPRNDIDISLFDPKNISIYFQGLVNRETALKYMLDSDVLVNIGNSTRFQLPSKLVEYTCTGKPVLNISSIAEDSSSTFLSTYPFSKTIFIKKRVKNEMINEVANYLNSLKSIESGFIDSWIEKHQTSNIAKQYEALFS
tara:strand:+ start:13974 stop:15296 length:1323 start_codon:yes stop_codon:yes gene_type:complete